VTVREHHFPVTGAAPSVEVRVPSGSVDLTGLEGAEEFAVRIEPLDQAARDLLDRVEVDGSGDRVRVVVPERRLGRTPSFAVRVSAPAGSAARVAVAAADARLTGRLGRVELSAASGDVSVEECADLQLRTASGDARVESVDGAATLATASGDVQLGSAAGALQVRTASGDINVVDAAGDASLSTASGDVSVGRVSSGTVQVKTVSGDAVVGVLGGLRVWLDLSSVSGRMDSQLSGDVDEDSPGPAQLTLAMRSVSGDLRVWRAADSPA
jgi:hypothetical protein